MSTTTSAVRSALLRVPGAQIYYEVQGSGPVLLMISGGPADAGIFAPLAELMSDSYTVVRYDPRGNSRSVLDGPPEDQRMDVHGDDAAQLLAVFGEEPAYVLGSSGGAQIGLNLAARHPQRVHTLVAHEPPCMGLLPDAVNQFAFVDSVCEIYRKEGVGLAMQKFVVGAGLAAGPQAQSSAPPSPEVMESFARMKGNADYFLGYGFRPIGLYIPDIATLRAGPAQIVVGVGQTSAESLPHRSALALAEQLGTAAVSFPGGHGGYTDNPAAFAAKLHQVLLGTHVATKP
jgi:pimeloyl-ACP methyl ester carboxylesterase